MKLSKILTTGRGRQEHDFTLALRPAWVIGKNLKPIVLMEISTSSWRQEGTITAAEARTLSTRFLEAAKAAEELAGSNEAVSR